MNTNDAPIELFRALEPQQQTRVLMVMRALVDGSEAMQERLKEEGDETTSSQPSSLLSH